MKNRSHELAIKRPRGFLFLHTGDIQQNHRAMQHKGVHFVRPSNEAVYESVAVFENLYGNLWDLIQPMTGNSRNN